MKYVNPCNCQAKCQYCKDFEGLRRGLKIWLPVSMVMWASMFLLAGCATVTPREAHLQAVKDSVDSRMVYAKYGKVLKYSEYLGGDGIGNCTDFSYTYMIDSKAQGINGNQTVCRLWDGRYHAVFVTDDGYVLDNMKSNVYKGNGCE